MILLEIIGCLLALAVPVAGRQAPSGGRNDLLYLLGIVAAIVVAWTLRTGRHICRVTSGLGLAPLLSDEARLFLYLPGVLAGIAGWGVASAAAAAGAWAELGDVLFIIVAWGLMAAYGLLIGGPSFLWRLCFFLARHGVSESGGVVSRGTVRGPHLLLDSGGKLEVAWGRALWPGGIRSDRSGTRLEVITCQGVTLASPISRLGELVSAATLLGGMAFACWIPAARHVASELWRAHLSGASLASYQVQESRLLPGLAVLLSLIAWRVRRRGLTKSPAGIDPAAFWVPARVRWILEWLPAKLLAYGWVAALAFGGALCFLIMFAVFWLVVAVEMRLVLRGRGLRRLALWFARSAMHRDAGLVEVTGCFRGGVLLDDAGRRVLASWEDASWPYGVVRIEDGIYVRVLGSSRGEEIDVAASKLERELVARLIHLAPSAGRPVLVDVLGRSSPCEPALS